jgi:DNA-binding NarL/FixJ family response regulator
MTAPERPRVVIGEDQALVREGLRLVLERHDFEIVGEAGDGEDLVRKALAHRPDVVVADIRMPPTQTDEGLHAALAIRAAAPDIALMVLSQHLQRRYAQELLAQAGEGAGIGYLLKQRVVHGEAFCADLRQVCAGRSVLDADVVAGILSRSPLDELSEPLREVLALMAEGRSNAAIAQRLVLSEKAVVKRVSRVYEELDIPPGPDDHRRVLAVVRYLAETDERALRPSAASPASRGS